MGRRAVPLVQQIRNEYHDPMPIDKVRQTADSGPIKSIASVISTARRYEVTLAGMDTLSGTLCYHLLLRPAQNQPHLRLRELWVDAKTNDTVQLIAWGNFGVKNVPWLVHFTHAGDATYITSEEALKPFDYNDHRYDNAAVEFDNVAASAQPTRAIGNLFVSKNVLMAEPEF